MESPKDVENDVNKQCLISHNETRAEKTTNSEQNWIERTRAKRSGRMLAKRMSMCSYQRNIPVWICEIYGE